MRVPTDAEHAELCAAIDAALAVAVVQRNTLIIALLTQSRQAADCFAAEPLQ